MKNNYCAFCANEYNSPVAAIPPLLILIAGLARKVFKMQSKSKKSAAPVAAAPSVAVAVAAPVAPAAAPVAPAAAPVAPAAAPVAPAAAPVAADPVAAATELEALRAEIETLKAAAALRVEVEALRAEAALAASAARAAAASSGTRAPRPPVFFKITDIGSGTVLSERMQVHTFERQYACRILSLAAKRRAAVLTGSATCNTDIGVTIRIELVP